MRKFICLLALLSVSLVSTNISAGRLEGPGFIEDMVSPMRVNSHKLTLKGNEYARITLKGDGGSDLDCFLLDDTDAVV
jgi:hypothetical protein